MNTITKQPHLEKKGLLTPKQGKQKDTFLSNEIKEPTIPDKWTVFRFVLKTPDLSQDVCDGMKNNADDPFKIITLEITEDGRIKNELTEINGEITKIPAAPSWDTITEFLKNGIKKFPSRHYMIEFDGHSNLIRPLLSQIKKAMKGMGKRVDIIKFASCTMAEAGISSYFKESADYLIASQAFTWCEKYLTDLKKRIKRNPKMLSSPETISKSIIKEDVQPTHSIINLKKTSRLINEIKGFGKELLKIEKEDIKKILDIINQTQHFAREYNKYEKTPLIDIKDLTDKIKNNTFFVNKYPDLIKSADKLQNAVKGAVVKEKHIDGKCFSHEFIKNTCGLSLFLPVKPTYETSYLYNPDLTFWKETEWKKVMAYLTG